MSDLGVTERNLNIGLKVGTGVAQTAAGHLIEKTYYKDIASRLPSVKLSGPRISDRVSKSLFDQIHRSTTLGSRVNRIAGVASKIGKVAAAAENLDKAKYLLEHPTSGGVAGVAVDSGVQATVGVTAGGIAAVLATFLGVTPVGAIALGVGAFAGVIYSIGVGDKIRDSIRHGVDEDMVDSKTWDKVAGLMAKLTPSELAALNNYNLSALGAGYTPQQLAKDFIGRAAIDANANSSLVGHGGPTGFNSQPKFDVVGPAPTFGGVQRLTGNFHPAGGDAYGPPAPSPKTNSGNVGARDGGRVAASAVTANASYQTNSYGPPAPAPKTNSGNAGSRDGGRAATRSSVQSSSTASKAQSSASSASASHTTTATHVASSTNSSHNATMNRDRQESSSSTKASSSAASKTSSSASSASHASSSDRGRR